MLGAMLGAVECGFDLEAAIACFKDGITLSELVEVAAFAWDGKDDDGVVDLLGIYGRSRKWAKHDEICEAYRAGVTQPVYLFCRSIGVGQRELIQAGLSGVDLHSYALRRKGGDSHGHALGEGMAWAKQRGQ
jgi:hypothetical protein